MPGAKYSRLDMEGRGEKWRSRRGPGLRPNERTPTLFGCLLLSQSPAPQEGRGASGAQPGEFLSSFLASCYATWLQIMTF